MAGHNANIGDKAECRIDRPKTIMLDVRFRGPNQDVDDPLQQTIQLKKHQWVQVMFEGSIVSVRLK